MSWNSEVRQRYFENEANSSEESRVERINKIHSLGKLSARERMAMLFDDGKYTEIEKYVVTHIDLEELNSKRIIGDGVIAGYGSINGVKCFAVSQDSTVRGGSGGETHLRKICRTLEMAIDNKCPMIFLCDSGGARIEEGILSLDAYSRLFYLNTKASGLIPQIAAIMGNCAGGSSYSPAMCDFVFMTKVTSQFFITGPKVIEALTGEKVTMDELGGSEIHSKYSGQAHLVCENDSECIEKVKETIGYIYNVNINQNDKRNKTNEAIRAKEIEEIVPENTRHSYDVKEVIRRVLDSDSFFEFQEEFAPNIVIGFGKLNKRTIGIVANQPKVIGGALDCDAADKCARFVRLCDCFNIPLLVLVDVPGFYPGKKQERKGILRHGCKMLYAFSEATVPRVSLIMRKGYGGAYCAMNSKGIGADYVLAWPIAELAVMGADGAVDVILKRQIENDDNPEKRRNMEVEKYREKYLTPYFAASCGMIDKIILPEDTRQTLISVFDGFNNKIISNTNEKKHGNISL